MIRFKHKGNFARTERFFERAKDKTYLNVLKRYGQAGVEALASATPKSSGETAASWGYEIARTESGYALYFTNSNVHQGVNIAMILQKSQTKSRYIFTFEGTNGIFSSKGCSTLTTFLRVM